MQRAMQIKMKLNRTERSAQWAICFASLVLWLALDTDFQSALWQVARLSIHQIGGTVRLDKVVLCLGWGCAVIALAKYRYGIATPLVLWSILGVGLIQLAFAACEVAIYELQPAGPLIIKYAWLGVIAWLVSQLSSITWVYFMLMRAGLVDRRQSLVSAVALGACAMMIWVGIFDFVHPGIIWRKL
jgi:hypothetical protein